jgi:putative acetyltransferase
MSINIRPYQAADIPAILNLFRESVHTVASRYYTHEQVLAWAPLDLSEDEQQKMEIAWSNRLASQVALIAELGDHIIGFISMTHEGYLDLLYVGKKYQAHGVAYQLFKSIESIAREKQLPQITTHASSMAVPLAKRMGFTLIKEDVVERRGISMPRYEMVKKL